MALFAPALNRGYTGFEGFLGSPEHIQELEKKAWKEGYIVYDDPFGSQKQLSGRFFEDLRHDVVEDLSRYQKNLLYVQGARDTMVKPEVGGIALQSMHPNCRLNYVYIDNADHGFGLWDNQPDQSERLVDVTSKFLGKNL